MTYIDFDGTAIDFGGVRVTTRKELKAAVKAWIHAGGGSLFCSSSLDFPKDYTNNQKLVFLCDLVRGNNVSGRNREFKRLDSLFIPQKKKVTT